jgi:glycosyltransferase involved in cell wall biosynthesis
MKVTFVNYYYDKDIPIEKYFDKYPTVYGWCKSLSEIGIQVKVYHRFGENYNFKLGGVEYFLVGDNLRNDLKWYQSPKEFHKKIVETENDIIHINSFNYAYQARLLKSKFPNIKLVIQHHAENPQNPVKRFITRYNLSPSDGFIFASSEIYKNWINKKIIPPGKKFSEIMEGSSNFVLENSKDARLKTGLKGSPILLWVGRLNENKDPITVLSGFLMLLNDYPEAKLYMIFSDEILKQQVLTFIDQNKSLKYSVNLLGYVDHKDLQDYYNSAGYFVLGSHYEGSGYSLVEAMSCGVIPIVTDIPSFRMITNNGEIGGLWNCGNAESFYKTAKVVLEKSIETESKKVIEQFHKNLSYQVIGLKAKEFYESLVSSN